MIWMSFKRRKNFVKTSFKAVLSSNDKQQVSFSKLWNTTDVMVVVIGTNYIFWKMSRCRYEFKRLLDYILLIKVIYYLLFWIPNFYYIDPDFWIYYFRYLFDKLLCSSVVYNVVTANNNALKIQIRYEFNNAV